MPTDDLFGALHPAYAALVKRLDQAADDVTDAIDSMERIGYQARLFIVPDGNGGPHSACTLPRLLREVAGTALTFGTIQDQNVGR